MLKKPKVWLCFIKEDQNKAKGDAGATDLTTNPTWCGENPDLNPVKWKIKVLPCNCSVVLSFKLFLKHLVSKNICRYEAGIEIGIVSKMSNDTHRYMPHRFGVLKKKTEGNGRGCMVMHHWRLKRKEVSIIRHFQPIRRTVKLVVLLTPSDPVSAGAHQRGSGRSDQSHPAAAVGPSLQAQRDAAVHLRGLTISSPSRSRARGFGLGVWPCALSAFCARTTWRRWRTSSSPWSWRKISPLRCFTRAWPSSTGACSRYVAPRPQPVAGFSLTYCPYIH